MTEELLRDQQIGRLASAVEGMTTNLMMADKEGIIQYLNPALLQLLTHREPELAQAFPGFKAAELVGKISTFSIKILHISVRSLVTQNACLSPP